MQVCVCLCECVLYLRYRASPADEKQNVHARCRDNMLQNEAQQGFGQSVAGIRNSKDSREQSVDHARWKWLEETGAPLSFVCMLACLHACMHIKIYACIQVATPASATTTTRKTSCCRIERAFPEEAHRAHGSAKRCVSSRR